MPGTAQFDLLPEGGLPILGPIKAGSADCRPINNERVPDMPDKPADSPPASAALLTALLVSLAATAAPAGAFAASDSPAPAGQMCPPGSYVIGFDVAANIVCSGVCGNGVVDAGEDCDDGNRAGGDGCSPACRAEAAAADAGAGAAASQSPPETPALPPAAAAAPAAPPHAQTPASAAEQAAPAAVPELSIEDVEPSSVVWGTRELTITVIGVGFAAGSVVLFNGATYEPAVEPSGTRLTVTLPTRDLPLGRYAVTVSDGASQQDTLKKALVVY